MTDLKRIILEAVCTPIHPDDLPIGGIVFLKMITGIGSPTLLRVCGV